MSDTKSPLRAPVRPSESTVPFRGEEYRAVLDADGRPVCVCYPGDAERVARSLNALADIPTERLVDAECVNDLIAAVKPVLSQIRHNVGTPEGELGSCDCPYCVLELAVQALTGQRWPYPDVPEDGGVEQIGKIRQSGTAPARNRQNNVQSLYRVEIGMEVGIDRAQTMPDGKLWLLVRHQNVEFWYPESAVEVLAMKRRT